MYKDIDINSLIGKKYADNGGDEINTFDCASLVRYVTGIDVKYIPSCKQGHTLEVIKAIEENKKHFTILDEPKEGCIVALSKLRKPSHVGVYLKGGVLHAIQGLGVVFSDLNNLRENGFTWEFGEIKNG